MANLEIVLERTALVLVDFNNGLLGIELYPHSGDVVLGNAVRLAEAFRKHEALVVLTTNARNAPPGGVYARSTAVVAPAERDMSALGKMFSIPDWGEVSSVLGPKEGDHLIRKLSWSAFNGTDLDFQLRRRGITTIVLGGIATNFGAEGTARDAKGLGYNVVAVEDAMRAMTLEEHEHSCGYTFPTIGRVSTTNDVLNAIGQVQ